MASASAAAATDSKTPLFDPDLKPFSQEDLKFFEENGYIVLRNAVSTDDCEGVVDAIWAFMGMDRNDSKDWQRPPASDIGFGEMYNHPAMWKNRQNPRLHAAFAQLLGTPRLWCSIDRVSFKVPSSKKYPGRGFTHWDMNPWDENEYPFELQGVLALEDTNKDMGGFHVVPGMHHTLREFIKKTRQIPNASINKFYNKGYPIKLPRDLKQMVARKSVKVEMKQGDFVIWRKELAHGNGCNKSKNRVRLAQYITYFEARDYAPAVTDPQQSLHPQSLQQRLAMFGTPDKAPTKAATGGKHQTGSNIAAASDAASRSDGILTPLGMRLLGLELWED
jgi:ectoine hydroxylase-related dioxygenase (phytanoyl-CoA dioxygenase family)